MHDLLTGALAAAQRRGEELLPILERWVRTNSFSSDFDGVNAMADHLVHDFDVPGLVLERRAGNDSGDHLAWRTAAWEARPSERVMLIGHHDTVFPPGTFEVWERQDDRLRGPGVLDMKGGLAVVRTAVAALADAGALEHVALAVVSVGDEEVGSLDSRDFLEHLARGAGAALVFEAGRQGDEIITQRKGTGKFKVRVKGRAAHAGNDHADGINAIRALSRFVDRAEALTDYERGVTLNVGTISGGTGANTVPAQAECQIDFRYVFARDGEALVSEVDRIARRIGAESGATFAIEGGIRRPPLERSDASVALMERYGVCAEAAGLDRSECPLIGGGSDANTVSALGVPAIDGLGPRGLGFHTHDEFIEVSTLQQRVDALVRFLLSDA
jgi:glutamate carboxypeptidase